MQVYAPGHASRRFNAQQMHAALASAAVFTFHLGIEAEHNRIKIVVCRVFAEQLLHIGKRHGLIHICLHVHLPNVAELLFDYAEYRIVQPERRNKQRPAAGYAYNAHEKALFIAEQVPYRHLGGKAELFPYERYFFKQHPPAGLWGLGAHERCRHFLKRCIARGKCCRGRADSHCRNSHKRYVCPVRRFKLAKVIHYGIALHYYIREQLKTDYSAHHAAAYACGHGIGCVLHGYLPAAVAKRLHGAHFNALFLNHSRHCGKAHKRRHYEEYKREHIAHGSNPVRIFAVIRIPGVAGSALNIPCAALGGCIILYAVGNFVHKRFVFVAVCAESLFPGNNNVSAGIICV